MALPTTTPTQGKANDPLAAQAQLDLQAVLDFLLSGFVAAPDGAIFTKAGGTVLWSVPTAVAGGLPVGRRRADIWFQRDVGVQCFGWGYPFAAGGGFFILSATGGQNYRGGDYIHAGTPAAANSYAAYYFGQRGGYTAGIGPGSSPVYLGQGTKFTTWVDTADIGAPYTKRLWVAISDALPAVVATIPGIIGTAAMATKIYGICYDVAVSPNWLFISGDGTNYSGVDSGIPVNIVYNAGRTQYNLVIDLQDYANPVFSIYDAWAVVSTAMNGAAVLKATYTKTTNIPPFNAGGTVYYPQLVSCNMAAGGVCYVGVYGFALEVNT